MELQLLGACGLDGRGQWTTGRGCRGLAFGLTESRAERSFAAPIEGGFRRLFRHPAPT